MSRNLESQRRNLRSVQLRSARRRVSTLVHLAVAIVTFAGPPVGATPPTAVSADPPIRARLDRPVNLDFGAAKYKSRGPTDVVLERFVFTRGGNSGWHRHPAPVLLLVAQGRVELVDGNCHVQQVSAGHAAIERGPGELTLVRNAGEVAAVIHLIHFVPPETQPIWLDGQAPTCHQP